MMNYLLKRLRYWLSAIVLVSGLFLLTNINQAYANHPSKGQLKDKTSNKPLVVILDWFINPDHAPLFVAQEKGFFKQAGIKVKLEPPAENADGPKLVAASRADIAITYQPQFIIQQSKQLPLSQIGTLMPLPLDCLVVLKNGPIKKIADLKGRRIGYPAGYSQVMLKTMLEKHGLSLKDVHLISTSQGLTQALLAHRIDGFTGAMRNFEPTEIALAGQKTRLFFPENNGFPLYSELILVTNSKEANDPRIHKFMVALQRGVIYLVNHPFDTWQLFAKSHPELDNKLNQKAWMQSLAFFALRPSVIDHERAKQLKVFLKYQGQIKD